MSLLVVIPTKDKKAFLNRPIYKSLQRLSDYGVKRKVIEPTRGLSVAYNEILTEDLSPFHTVVFVHDDVEVEDLYFVDKFKDSPYDITVCAGATSFHKNSENLAWHLASERKDWRGEVAHISNNKVWTTIFGSPGRVLTFDGVCFGIKMSTFLKNPVYFDDDMEFHFYDTAFALRAYNAGWTAGIPERPLRIIHHGLGDSMLSDSFNTSQQIFRKKYVH